MTRIVAWLALLPASPFAAILSDAVFHVSPPAWLPLVNLAASAALLALAYVLPGLKPIRGYLLSITLLVLGYLILFQIESTQPWRTRFDSAPAWQFVFADSLLELIPCALLTLSLIGSGLSRRELFLTPGNLRAPFTLPFGLPSVSWSWWGAFLTLFLAIPFVMQLASTVRPNPNLLQGLPLALAFAIFNSAQEEYRFRAVLLARLAPAVGGLQALLMTSVLFGLGHWFGHPSGPAGVVMAGFAGFLWGKSMLDTRGFVWAWIIHGFMDVLIFMLIVVSGR